MMEAHMNAIIIKSYHEARAHAAAMAAQHGSRSVQFCEALTDAIAVEQLVVARGLSQQAGVRYANVWD